MKISRASIRTSWALIFLFLTGCGNPWFSRDDAIDHYVSALALNAAELDEDAIKELQAAVKIDRDFSLAFSLMGDLYRRQGNYEQAAGAYENACALDAWAFDDHLHLGQVYQVLKRFVEAIKVLKRACLLQPESVEANYTLGVCFYETEDYDQAAKFCAKAAQLDPANDEILASLGDIYGKSGDHYQAVNAYKQALEIDGRQVEVMIKLGNTYVQMNRFAPAKLILQKAIDTRGDDAQTHIAMAYCLLAERNLEGALAGYQKAAELEKTHPDAHNGVGVAYMMMYLKDKRNKEPARQALSSWHISLELDPDQPKIQKLVQRYTAELYPSGQ